MSDWNTYTGYSSSNKKTIVILINVMILSLHKLNNVYYLILLLNATWQQQEWQDCF